jgi:hypothetical protein
MIQQIYKLNNKLIIIMTTIMNQKNTVTQKKPSVGVPHFKTKCKEVRNSGYDTEKCLGDLIDYPIVHATTILINIRPNAERNGIHMIHISDDCPRGFEQIDCSNEDSPLNMGHIRVGHADDSETSEFGQGMKNAFINLCESVEIKTHAISERGTTFKKVEFDFINMMLTTEAELSYEPETMEDISESTFTNHNARILGTIGSDIKLTNIRNGSDNCFDDFDEFIKRVMNYISLTYSDYLKPGVIRETAVTIRVNDMQVEPLPDYFEDEICQKRLIHHDIHVLLKANDNQIDKILVSKQNRKKVSHFVYDSTKKDETKLEAVTFDVFDDVMRKNINMQSQWKQMTFNSTSIYGTPYHYKDCELPNNKIRIKRRGRNHGDIEQLTRKYGDGYSNHIYNELTYDAKQLNKFVGIAVHKGVNSGKRNPLISIIHELQKFTISKLKSDKLNVELSSDDDVGGDEPKIVVKPKKPRKTKGGSTVVSEVVTNVVVTGSEDVVTDIVGVGLTNGSETVTDVVTDIVGVGSEVVTDIVGVGSEVVTDIVGVGSEVVSNSSEEEEYEETVWSTVGSEEPSSQHVSNIVTLNDKLNECISMQYNSWDEFWERNNANIIKWMQSHNHM